MWSMIKPNRLAPRFPAVAGAMVAATVALSAQQVTFEPPRTPWGDPDLEGIYTARHVYAAGTAGGACRKGIFYERGSGGIRL